MIDRASASWNLKLDRAEVHLQELGCLIDDYIEGHFYRAICANPPKRKPSHWRFVLEITKQPGPDMALVLGDLLYNVRSALDHIAVAIAPKHRKSSAGFPLIADRERDRDAFESRVADMAPEAIAVIERYQPYNFKSDVVPQRMFSLAGLSAIQNADKHRNLVVLTAGLIDPQVTVSWAGESITIGTPVYLEPGAEVVRYDDIGNRIPYSEVQVEVSGSPAVSVVLGARAVYPLADLVKAILTFVRARVIEDLEPFAIPRG